MKHLGEQDYAVSAWSGGKTVQLAIRPGGAVYADRDFLWRLSSATVDLPESDFTSLPGYDRLIAPLTGSMELTHGKEDGSVTEPLLLKPYTVHRFDGADRTHSAGCCTDFNLMLRKGRCGGRMEVLASSGVYRPDGRAEVLVLYAARGQAELNPENGGRPVLLSEKESLILEQNEISPVRVKLSEGGALAAAEIWKS